MRWAVEALIHRPLAMSCANWPSRLRRCDKCTTVARTSLAIARTLSDSIVTRAFLAAPAFFARVVKCYGLSVTLGRRRGRDASGAVCALMGAQGRPASRHRLKVQHPGCVRSVFSTPFTSGLFVCLGFRACSLDPTVTSTPLPGVTAFCGLSYFWPACGARDKHSFSCLTFWV